MLLVCFNKYYFTSIT